MWRWSLALLVLAAVAALVSSSGACGSSITVPDQGIIVTGCMMPSACFLSTCDCKRGSVTSGACTTPSQCSDPTNPSTCKCPDADMLASNGAASSCLEPAQACVGRGVFCGGANALCVPAGGACSPSTAGAAPPMLISTIGMPMLEPHCQFVDDVCCPGAMPDGGLPPTDMLPPPTD